MNELQELHIKGELTEKGYLKETYDNEINDLNHELTNLGKAKIKELFKDPEYKKEFLRMAAREAMKYPEHAKQIIQEAINKIKEYSHPTNQLEFIPIPTERIKLANEVELDKVKTDDTNKPKIKEQIK